MARRIANLVALAAAAAAKCEVLRSLEFQQHTAPKGVSELLGPVVSLVSEKAEVGDIKIRWDGELGLHRVGTHKILAENSDGACFDARPRHERVPRDRGSCGDGRALRDRCFGDVCIGEERAWRRVTRLHIHP